LQASCEAAGAGSVLRFDVRYDRREDNLVMQPSSTALGWGRLQRLIAFAAIVGVSLMGTIVVESPATATTPGRNGRIAFGSDHGNGFEIYTIWPDGSHYRRLTHVDGDAYRPDWAPDGHRIAFELDDPVADTAHVVIMNADGTHMHDLTGSHFEAQPAFTPDGHHLVYECGDCPGGDGIFIMGTDGSHRRRLTTNPFTDMGDHNAEVSPDGGTITFVRNKVDFELQALFAIRRDGTHLHRIAPYSLEVAIKHDWAPSGHQLLVTPYGDYPSSQAPNVAIMRPTGSYLRILTRFTVGQRGAFAGSYSPNGRWIVFREENLVKGTYKLLRMHKDGTHRRLIKASQFSFRGIDWGARH
jgi:Tol biopolymer transport system component